MSFQVARSRRFGPAVGSVACALTLLASIAVAPGAHAAVAAGARPSVLPAAAAGSGAYAGYSTGDVVYAQAAQLPPATLARASVAQSAAGVAVGGGTLQQSNQLGEPLSAGATAATTAYGHAAGVGVSLAQGQTAPPQVALSTADAVSPPPASSASTETAAVPIPPLLSANVLPGTAAANTTADGSCVLGKPISSGNSHVASADLLTAPGVTVASLAATVDSTSTTTLVSPTAADGSALSSGGAALETETVQHLAPLTLFAGTPAATTITVLAPLRLAAEAGGVPGSAVVSYAPVGVGPTSPLLTLSISGNTQTLTTQQVLGSGGIQLHLGLADVLIGGPAHALTSSAAAPTTAADGTAAAAAVDLVQVTVPGATPPATDPFSGPLVGLNQLVNPLVTGLSPVLAPLQAALAGAGLGVADLRYGHFEATATAPLGGIVCASGVNPFSEDYKDVSALSAAPGATFTYTVRFPNRGSMPVTNVTVTDTFSGGPPPLSFVGSVPSPSSTSGSTLTYTIGTLAPGQYADVVLTFRVPAGAPTGLTYHNSAVIAGTYAGQPVGSTVTADGPTVTAPGAGGCDLSHSTKYASNLQVTTGEKFTYYINVFNSGGATCTGVTVTDPLPSGVAFVTASNGGTASGSTVAFALGDLAPGSSQVVSVTVSVTATSGTLPDTAAVRSSNGGSGNPATPGPTVTATSVGSPGAPAACGPGSCPGAAAAPARAPLAQTGASTAVAGMAALLLLPAAGLGLALRRRRTG